MWVILYNIGYYGLTFEGECGIMVTNSNLRS